MTCCDAFHAYGRAELQRPPRPQFSKKLTNDPKTPLSAANIEKMVEEMIEHQGIEEIKKRLTHMEQGSARAAQGRTILLFFLSLRYMRVSMQMTLQT